VAFAAAGAGLLAGAPAAGAAERRAVAVGLNYATPVLAVNQGDTLRFDNLDVLSAHTLTSNARDEFNDRLFYTGFVQSLDSAPVFRVEELAPGDYSFFCEVHPIWMRGILRVAEPGTLPDPPVR
jgi:plastocyanin